MIGVKPKIAVFLASVRPNRNNDRVAKLVQKALTGKQCEVKTIDPKEFNLPLLTTPLHWHPDRSQAPDQLHQLNSLVEWADGFIVTSGEYNRACPPALVNLLDYLPHASFAYKPVGLVAYSLGATGGVMSTIQLRTMLAELGALVTPHAMLIAGVDKRLSPEGDIAPEHESATIKELNVVIDQVLFLHKTISPHRGTGLYGSESSQLPRIHNYV